MVTFSKAINLLKYLVRATAGFQYSCMHAMSSKEQN